MDCIAIIVALLGLITAYGRIGTRRARTRYPNRTPIAAHLTRSRPFPPTTTNCSDALSYLLYAIANVATTGVLFYQFTYVLGMPRVSPSRRDSRDHRPGHHAAVSVAERLIPRRWLFAGGMGLMILQICIVHCGPTHLVVLVALILFYLPAQTIQMTAILTMTDSIEYGQLKTRAAQQRR